MEKICLRDECDNPLKTGKFYCSSECAALAREARKRNGVQKKTPPALVRSTIPDPIVTMMTNRLGDNAYEVLEEMAVVTLEDAPPAAPLAGKTEGDWTYSYWIGGQDRRPSDALNFEVIDEMLKCGPVAFILEMKISALMTVWRNERTWKAISPDKELADMVTANLRQIMPMAALQFVRPSLSHGASFNELEWEYKTAYQLGMSKSKGAQKTYATLKLPLSCNPESIDRILRTKDGSFNGFVQRAKLHPTAYEHKVDVDQALVIPYKMQFRNLWGESYLKVMYPIWFWYEVALRSWVRYLERMGTPVAVCYAPSRAKVRKSDSSTLVDAMTWGLAIAGNIAKSNAAALPSDTDPQTNQPLWRLEYLTAEDRGTVFKDALDMLLRLLTQAGMSAELAFSRPSGGTGSYNLGQTHAAQTARHNELIFIEQLWMLNKHLMPKFSLYNRGENGPPIWLETEGLDPVEQENLFKIAGLAGNSAGFQDAIMMIDWETLWGENGIPILTKKEMQQLKEQLQEEALQKQKDFIKAQTDAGGPPASGQRPDFAKQNEKEEQKTPAAKAASDQAKKLQNLAYMIVDGQYAPVILTDDQMANLFNIRRSGVDVAIETEETDIASPFELEQRRWPAGSPGGKGGQFAPARGGTGGAAAAAGGKGKAGGVSGDGIKPAKGSFLSTTGKILGLAGLGAVALAVVGAAAGGGPDLEEQRAERAEKVRAEIDELTKDWPKFENEQQAFDEARKRLADSGVQLEPDIKFAIDDSKVRAGSAGNYDKDTNTLYVRSDLARELAEGDPAAVQVLMHEAAHSGQEIDSQTGFGNWGNGQLMQDEVNEARFRDYFEGQNDLVALTETSGLYGQPLDNDAIADMHNRRQELGALERMTSSGVQIGVTHEISDLGYQSQAATYAGLVTAQGGDRFQNLYDGHASGFDQMTHYELLQELFPQRIRDFDEGYYPPYQIVAGWLRDDYGVDTGQAFRDMLEEAAR